MAKANSLPPLSELEKLIRDGDFAAVVKAVSSINRNKIPRAELAKYANIANRVNQGRVAHRFLLPVVKSEKESIHQITDQEKIEYAEASRIMGQIEEAKQMLSEIDPTKQPLADLRMAFCLMTQWQYQEAIPFLRNYLTRIGTEDYLFLIAQVNLAASLVIERQDEEAVSLLLHLKEKTFQCGHRLLYGNCLELLAQLYIQQGRCELADSVLKEAEAAFSNEKTRYSLYWMKWKAISKSLQLNAVDAELLECRRAAFEIPDWETVRECDLYIGWLSKDQNLISNVYFGTPYSPYRKRILRLAGELLPYRESHVWNQTPEAPVREVFDLIEGKMISPSTSTGLDQGHLMHRFLILLAMDFYRPLSVVSAFSELFPGEHFTHEGSTNRISQIVKRLRAWSKEHGGPFSIEENAGSYRLRLKPGVGLQVPREWPNFSKNDLTWNKFIGSLSQDLFSKNDLIGNMKISSASASRLLRWSLSAGHCEVVGSGPLRKYRLLRK